MKGYNKTSGFKGEDLAVRYLKSQGYKILERNYLIRGGEIDIVAQEGEILVFIEVKARWSHQYGHPLEAINYYKMKAMLKTALFYIQKINWGDKPYRLDAISIDYAEDKQSPKIELIRNIT